MWNDARIRHPNTECVFAFLYIAWVHARCGNTNANLSGQWLRIFHFTDHQNNFTFSAGVVLR